MCSKESCPCRSVDISKWNSYEQAILLGSRPDQQRTPTAYFPEKRRNFYFRDDAWIKTFGQCYEIYSEKEKNTTIDEKFLKGIELIEGNLNCQGICKPALFWFFRPIGDG